jgi:hypothetical protein
MAAVVGKAGRLKNGYRIAIAITAKVGSRK